MDDTTRIGVSALAAFVVALVLTALLTRNAELRTRFSMFVLLYASVFLITFFAVLED